MALHNVTLNGITATYRAHELDEMRELRRNGATDHELRIVHELKARLDGVFYHEPRWRRPLQPVASPAVTRTEGGR